MNSAPIVRNLGRPEPTWWADRTVIGVFLLAAFAVWMPDNAFFWRDDWEFLKGFREAPGAFLVRNHYGHVKPVFKLFYLLELHAFGTNTILFTFINLVLFGLGNYAIFRLARSLTSTPNAWAIAAAGTLHPLMFNHLGWSFQQCITLHLLFQVLAVYHFLRWAASDAPRSLVPLFLFTALQHYSFGNGIFLPVLFVVGAFLFVQGPRRKPLVIGMTAYWLCTLAIQMLLGGDRHESLFDLQAIPAMLRADLHFLGSTLSGIFFLREGVLGMATPWIASGIFIALVVLALLNKRGNMRLAAFLLLWFLICTCSIPMVMQERLLNAVLPHYYFVLGIVPVLLILEHAVAGRFVIGARLRPVVAVGVVGLVLGTFLVDQHLKGLFSYRNMRNKQFMLESIRTGAPYHGFDEPYFTTLPGRMEEPTELYRYWMSRDRFTLPFVPQHLEPVPVCP